MKVVLLLIYILLILGVIFIERKSPTEAVLWVLVMVCLPYVGVFFYLVFGSTFALKINAYLRRKRLKKYYEGTEKEKKEYKQPSYDLSKFFLSEEDMQVMNFNSVYNQSEISCYDGIDIYTGGKSHYEKLFDDIKHAKHNIYIEFYTIHHDAVGEAFVAALAKKAAEGLDVLVLCDSFANLSTPEKMFAPLREAGGKVIRMKPFLTHYRSHRKIVVIDHNISYIGGMNIGVQYADQAKVKTPWRDTQVRMTGRSAEVLDRYFLIDWLCSVKRKDFDSEIRYMDELPAPRTDMNDNLCQFVVGGADNDKESVKMCYLSMIRSAKKCIRIQTPYFVPDESILDALKTAAAAGVKIKLMIPGIKASFFLDPVTTYYAGQLLEYGAEIYKYKGYIHAKTLVIDDELCCIGSVNMDMRSLMVDDEVCGVFYSNGFAKRYLEIYEKDIENCTPYTFKQFEMRSTSEKFAESFFLLFAPLM